MDDIRVDIIHKWSSPPPSLKNLLQGLREMSHPLDLHIHPLAKPTYRGSTKLTSAVELGALTLLTIRTYLSLREQTDVVIIHKTLGEELIEHLLGINIAERLLLRLEPVIHTTYDADYVYYPKKSWYLFDRSTLIIATSEAIRRTAEMTADPDQVVSIPPSVDTSFFAPTVAVPPELQTDALVLGWVGNPDVHEDNLRYLADQLSDAELSGDVLRFLLDGGTLPEDVREKLAATGANLEVIPRVPWEEVPAVINSFDVGLAPLRDTPFDRGRSSEKIREYMACGVPVIASAVGENPRLVPADTGFLPDADRGWASAIEQLNNPDRRREMGRAARQHVAETYATTVVAEELAAVIEQVGIR